MIDKTVRKATIDKIETAIENAVNDFSRYGYNKDTMRGIYEMFATSFVENKISFDDYARYRELFYCIANGG